MLFSVFFLLFLQKSLVNGFLTVSFNKVVNNFEREPKISLTNRTLGSFIRKGYLKEKGVSKRERGT